MKTHEITTSNGEFLVADYISLMTRNDVISYFGGKNDTITISGVDYKLICKLSEVTEDDLKKVFEYLLANDNDEYGDYEVFPFYHKNGTYTYLATNRMDSIHSLLKSKGIDVNNGNWYLFKKL